jgi:hypothetical protein
LDLTAWTIYGPDPTTVSKWVTGSLVLVLIVVDAVSDPLYEACQARTRELLQELETDERYYVVRQGLLGQMDQAVRKVEAGQTVGG